MNDQVLEAPVRAAAGTDLEPTAGPFALAMLAMRNNVPWKEACDLAASQMEFDGQERRKAFYAAMTEFKKHPPQILKDMHGAEFNHATLGAVCEAVTAAAAEHGFTHRWKASEDGDRQVITCIITHVGGHSEGTELSGPRDDSEHMNPLQGIGSATTYLSRYTLLLGYGMAPKNMPDDDGQGSGAALNAQSSDPAGLQVWLQSAETAKTVDKLTSVRQLASAHFTNSNDLAGWETFKKTYAARRSALKAAEQ